MTININPPPLQIPPEFASDKIKRSFFSGLINTLYQLWTAVYGLNISFKVITNDDSATAALRVPIDTGKTTMIVAHIAARRTGGTNGTEGDSAWYRLMGAYKNIDGVLTGIGDPTLFGGEDQAGWDFYFTAGGTEAVVTVKGADGNDITWEGSVTTYVVGA